MSVANEEQQAWLERETEWSHATALGEAVWRRISARRKIDYKDPLYLSAHNEVVELVRASAFVLEREGFEGLAEYLKREDEYDCE